MQVIPLSWFNDRCKNIKKNVKDISETGNGIQMPEYGKIELIRARKIEIES
jgi:hypothetical protein